MAQPDRSVLLVEVGPFRSLRRADDWREWLQVQLDQAAPGARAVVLADPEPATLTLTTWAQREALGRCPSCAQRAHGCASATCNCPRPACVDRRAQR